MGIFDRFRSKPEVSAELHPADTLDFSAVNENERRIKRVFGRREQALDIEALMKRIDEVRAVEDERNA